MTRRFFFWTALALVIAAGIALATRGAATWWGKQSPTATAEAAPARQSLPVVSADASATVGSETSAGNILASGRLPKGNAETRLVEVFSLIEKGQLQQALLQAEALTRDQPNFHLAHLVKADLLKLRYQPNAAFGVPSTAQTDAASTRLAALRTETQMRLSALRERPPEGHVPHQFLALAAQSRHAIAVDASRSRLYLFENLSRTGSTSTPTPPNLRLIGDFFISLGKSGINKRLEGDGRTPLGAYYITSLRDKKSLPDFYGAGALPINYPNAFDVQRGRTGSGIWLHGSPPEQYVRAPLASDGCVVLSNPDMDKLLKLVEPRTTPVIIAEQLQWVPAAALVQDTSAFNQVLMSWQTARSQATPEEFAQLFDRTALTRTGFAHKTNGSELLVHSATQLGVANLSLLKWQDPNTSMVATFEETANGQPTGVVRRQYWSQHPEGWRLLQDTVMAGNPGNLPRRPAAAPPAVASSAQSAPDRKAKTDADSPASPASSPSAAQTQQVRQAVAAWARAWSQKNVAQYLGAYSPSFTPPGGLSRKAWEQERLNRIVSKSKITVTLSQMKVQVDGNNATVTFVQSYKADQLAVSSRKTLKMVKRGDKWLISQENVGGR